MADGPQPRQRYGEAFWRAHHEAWKRSDLNQREYARQLQPQPSVRKLLYRRGRLSHPLSYTLTRRCSSRCVTE